MYGESSCFFRRFLYPFVLIILWRISRFSYFLGSFDIFRLPVSDIRMRVLAWSCTLPPDITFLDPRYIFYCLRLYIFSLPKCTLRVFWSSWYTRHQSNVSAAKDGTKVLLQKWRQGAKDMRHRVLQKW